MNERYCPKCGKFKALSAPLCDRCIEAEATNSTDTHRCTEAANSSDAHKCPKCGRLKALSAPLCDRCIEAEATNSLDALKCTEAEAANATDTPNATETANDADTANATGTHKCPQCGKFKFEFQSVCYDCKLSQSMNIIQNEIEYVDAHAEEDPIIEHETIIKDQAATDSKIDIEFHKEYSDNNEYKCKCGIYVKSKDEQTIADFLHENEISFQYEPMNDYYAYDINLNSIVRKEIYPDFFIKGPVTLQDRRIENVYIEYWGLNTPEYLESKAQKLKVYKDHNCTLINLYPEDLYDSENSLTEKLTQFIDRQLNY